MSTETKAAAGRDTSRIHNIGYRSYDGRRLGRAYARRSLYSQTLRGSFGLGRSAKSKVLPMLLFGVMTLVAAILVAVSMVTPDSTKLVIKYTSYAIYLQAVIGLFIAAQAPQAVSRDLRFKSVPLYFSRPIERADYVLAKLAATASALFILTGAPLLILYVGSLLAKFDFVDQTKWFGQGLVSVALLSVLFAGLGLVMAALTPRRGFGVAAVIAVLTISYGAVSTVQAIACDPRPLFPGGRGLSYDRDRCARNRTFIGSLGRVRGGNWNPWRRSVREIGECRTRVRLGPPVRSSSEWQP
ncbi:hypothetical protein SCYAM73S_02271 [Streptomyces cyaneofuscatus]